MDPITGKYLMLSPYQFASNSPIAGIDLDGREFGVGWVVDYLSEGTAALGLTRTSGFISSYGHSLAIDPLYTAVKLTKKISNGQYGSAAQDFDISGVSGAINLYQIGKKALNGDKFAQGQFIGSLPAIYGGIKGIKAGTSGGTVPTVDIPNAPAPVEGSIVNPEQQPMPVTQEQAKANVGQATTNDYRSTFFKAYPKLLGKVIVHHAVEQQVLKIYPGLFTEAEINSLENLRGIPKDINSNLHLSEIRKNWNDFYKNNPNATRQDILNHASEVDKKYGGQFNP